MTTVYVSGQRQYQSFCREANVTIFLLSEHKACLFDAHLVRSGLKPSTIKVYLSAVRRLQVEAVLGDPFTASWPVLESVVNGAKRKRQSREASEREITLDPWTYENSKEILEEAMNYESIMLWAACILANHLGFSGIVLHIPQVSRSPGIRA